jgi:RND family efflux transporter MFP subunit
MTTRTSKSTVDSRQLTVTAPACFALALGLAIADAGCRDVQGAARPLPRPVKVAEARAADSRRGLRYAVSIQPHEQIPLAFKTSGYIDQVRQRRGADGRVRPVQAGDDVAAGAVLAHVRESDYRERLNQAAASIAEIETAQAKAQLDLDRARILFAAEALTKPELDAARAAYDANVARIASAQAQREMARTSLGDTALVAPRSGVILERKIELGSLVGGGTVAFVLADVGSVKALFGVPDSVVHRLSLGQPLAITSEAFHGAKFTGRITAIAPSAEAQSRVFDVEVTIPNGDRRLRPGMIGAVELTGSAADPDTPAVPAIPLTAIVRSESRPDQYAVFVVGDAGAQPTVQSRPITLGPIVGNLVAVNSGLSNGERVVVMGATLLKDGEIVRVIP